MLSRMLKLIKCFYSADVESFTKETFPSSGGANIRDYKI